MSEDPVIGWLPSNAAEWIRVPAATDDKYSRGVLGMATGSAQYPGAAVLGVEAAARTGIGMIRYRGANRPTRMVLDRRPETVTAAGRCQAWLIGSGMDAESRSDGDRLRLQEASAAGLPMVVDAGALDLIAELPRPLIITPHFRELSRVLTNAGCEVSPEQIGAAPEKWAVEAAQLLDVTVLLKGTHTVVTDPQGSARYGVGGSSSWLATAGTGDVLAGILGALVATNSARILAEPTALARVGATAALLHARAAQRASAGGPIVALDVAEAVPSTIAGLLRTQAAGSMVS